MKYCAHCGAEIDNEAVICIKCGRTVDGALSHSSPSDNWNVLAIVGFALSFFSTIVGLILSIIGYKQAKASGEKGKELALAGIIISSVSIALVLIIVIVEIGMFAALWSTIIQNGGL